LSDKTSTGLAIEAKGLVKAYEKQQVVDGVDLSIPQGIVYGFLGPNGAGKTTTIRMLSTLTSIDGGTVKIFGKDLASEPKEVRKQISLAGQYASLDEDLTGMENLVLIAKLLGYSRKQAKIRASEILSAFGLEEAAKRQVKNYSGGMRRRIDIAGSMVNTPKILFLDEPTTGLDPKSRSQVWDIISALKEAGTTVLLTTQYLEEADYLADRIAIIKKGSIIAEGTIGELKASMGMGALRVRFPDEKEFAKAKRILSTRYEGSFTASSNPFELLLPVNDSMMAMEEMRKVEAKNIRIHDFSFGQPSLDEVFLQLTSQSFHEDPRKEGAI